MYEPTEVNMCDELLVLFSAGNGAHLCDPARGLAQASEQQDQGLFQPR